MRNILFALIGILVLAIVMMPARGDFEPATDQTLIAYINGCLSDETGTITIETTPLLGTEIAVDVTLKRDVSDKTLRPFIVYEMADNLGKIGSAFPDIFSVNCRLIEGNDVMPSASLEWDLK